LEHLVKEILQESLSVKEAFILAEKQALVRLAERIATSFSNDGKLLLCGNGGSAADAQHLAAEFVNRFQMERPPLPALALTTDTSTITSIANDYSFEEVFSKQVKALGKAGDVLLAITTSGRSANLLSAAKTARQMGLFTAALLGGGGGELRDKVDLPLVVDSSDTARVQEAHSLAGHILCFLVDHILFHSHHGQDEALL